MATTLLRSKSASIPRSSTIAAQLQMLCANERCCTVRPSWVWESRVWCAEGQRKHEFHARRPADRLSGSECRHSRHERIWCCADLHELLIPTVGAGGYELVGHKYKVGEPRCAEQLREILERFLPTPCVGSTRNRNFCTFEFGVPTAAPIVASYLSSRHCEMALRTKLWTKSSVLPWQWSVTACN
jgi:hypothetical protein